MLQWSAEQATARSSLRDWFCSAARTRQQRSVCQQFAAALCRLRCLVAVLLDFTAGQTRLVALHFAAHYRCEKIQTQDVRHTDQEDKRV